ncbi:MAG: hypothetical protein VX949_11135 [Planctomycetota bacterium]|nr:hypothetical protein [Planctomycetota bacterium]
MARVVLVRGHLNSACDLSQPVLPAKRRNVPQQHESLVVRFPAGVRLLAGDHAQNEGSGG